MKAALRKISHGMPELAGETEALAELVERQLVEAWGEGEQVENGDFPGHPFRGNQYSKDHFGRKPHPGMTPEQNYQRVTKCVEWAARNHAAVEGIAYRKGVGMIDLPWGNTGDKSADHKTGKGLAHVDSKHPRDVKGIAEVIAYGTMRKGKSADKRELWLGRRVAVLVKRNKNRSWLLTSYSDD